MKTSTLRPTSLGSPPVTTITPRNKYIYRSPIIHGHYIYLLVDSSVVVVVDGVQVVCRIEVEEVTVVEGTVNVVSIVVKATSVVVGVVVGVVYAGVVVITDEVVVVVVVVDDRVIVVVVVVDDGRLYCVKTTVKVT